jgi:hypothetical protein
MMDNIDEVTNKRLMSLREIEKDKIIVAKNYNKKVKTKSSCWSSSLEDSLAIKEKGLEYGPTIWIRWSVSQTIRGYSLDGPRSD